jgi:penicillin amidase
VDGALRTGLYADELAGQWGKVFEQGFVASVSANVSTDNLLSTLATDNNQWCDDISTPIVEDCQAILARSLNSTLKRLTKLRGSDLTDWQWGEVSRTAYDHRPFSELKLFDNVFQRKISNGGSTNTINVASSTYHSSEGYLQSFGAGFRQIISMGEGNQPTRHLLMNSTGQSGNVMSDHYDDMVVPFRDVAFITMGSATERTIDTLLLTPLNQTEESH